MMFMITKRSHFELLFFSLAIKKKKKKKKRRRRENGFLRVVLEMGLGKIKSKSFVEWGVNLKFSKVI